jgi:hypothetical protein
MLRFVGKVTNILQLEGARCAFIRNEGVTYMPMVAKKKAKKPAAKTATKTAAKTATKAAAKPKAAVKKAAKKK